MTDVSSDPHAVGMSESQVMTRPRAARASGCRAALGVWVEARALFIVAVSVVIVLSLLGIPNHFSQDGWLALNAGREIAAHGIPHRDYFTHMAYGVRWVDQQWLAQLLMYELERLGGMQMLTVVYVLITGAAFATGVGAARALGGEDLHVLTALVPGAFFYLVTAVSIRTQGLAYPLFVATLWLLAAETRSPVRRRRVYWVFPALLLWANVHGSVTMGVGLACLYGLTLLINDVREHGASGFKDIRAWTFVLASPLTLLATPYGTSIIHYYGVTLMNSQFGRLVSEWKPVSSVPILAVPLLVVMAATLYTIVRAILSARSRGARTTPLFDVLVLVALAVGAITAVRNITWFGLALVVLLPAALSQMKGGGPAPLRRARINLVFAVALAAIAVLGSVVVLGRPDAWFTSTYPVKAIPTLRALVAAKPRVKIYADVRYADWLIWEDPNTFSGRLAYDTSLELLTPSQLNAIADPAAGPRDGPKALLQPYGIWVLYPGNKSVVHKLLRRPGVRVVTRNAKMIIATHPVSAGTGASA
ncbi:MAG TPA: hypothetical protein VHV75_04370 [Solirubrobacteraceae bacterium]|nr:hypothetical protein [Solirubrobacteraceae bacterium]